MNMSSIADIDTNDANRAHPTPGPWDVAVAQNIAPGNFEVALAIRGGRPQPGKKNSVVCLVAPESDTTQEDSANAHLIAAAPDFFNACMEQPGLSRIGWLRILRDLFSERTNLAIEAGYEVPDEDAELTMLLEVTRLIDGLLAAISKARGDV